MNHVLFNNVNYKTCAICEGAFKLKEVIIWNTDLDYKYHFDCYKKRTLKDLEILEEKRKEISNPKSI